MIGGRAKAFRGTVRKGRSQKELDEKVVRRTKETETMTHMRTEKPRKVIGSYVAAPA